jgi:hypothetical protein
VTKRAHTSKLLSSATTAVYHSLLHQEYIHATVLKVELTRPRIHSDALTDATYPARSEAARGKCGAVGSQPCETKEGGT